MTRREFSSNYEACLRQGSKYGMATTGVIFLPIIAAAFLANYLQKHYEIGWLDNAVAVFALCLFICAIIAMILQDGPMVRRFGLVCPTCRRRLTPVETRRKLLLTGNCPHCGNNVFDREPANRTTPSYGLNREEFRAKLEVFHRKTKLDTVKVLVIIFIAILICIPTTKYFQRLVDRGGLDWVTLTQWRWFAVLALVAICVASVGIFIFAFRGKFKANPVLPCPECHRSLIGIAGKMAVENGLCIFCGCQLFEVPSSESEERFHCE